MTRHQLHYVSTWEMRQAIDQTVGLLLPDR